MLESEADLADRVIGRLDGVAALHARIGIFLFADMAGFTARASQANADVTRDINGEVMTGRVLLSDPLLPGDTVYIRERLF